MVTRIRPVHEAVPTLDLAAQDEADGFQARGAIAFPEARPVTWAAGDAIFAEGEVAEQYYLVLDGEVELRRDGRAPRRVAAGSGFGDVGLQKGTRRHHGAVARTRVRCLTVDRRGFRQLLADADVLSADIGRAVYREYMRRVVQQTLPNLDRRTADSFERRYTFHRYEPGEVIVRQGEAGTTFFLLIAGDCDVHRDGQLVKVMRAPDAFGEIAFLQQRPRTATVSASLKGPVEVVGLDGTELAAMLQRSRGAREDLIRMMSDRFLNPATPRP